MSRSARLLVGLVLAAVTAVPAVGAAIRPGSTQPVVLRSASLATRQPTAAAAPPDSAYVPVGPLRLADTRAGGGYTRIGSSSIRVPVTGRPGVPAGLVAVVVDLTVTRVVGPGFVAAAPTGAAATVSQLTMAAAGQTRSAAAIVRVGAGGQIDISSSVPADLIVDLLGGFVPATSASAGRYQAAGPVRLLDTRRSAALPAGAVVTLPLPAGVPADATAIAVNLTSAPGFAPGYVTAYAAGRARPVASALTVDAPGEVRAAFAIVPVWSRGLSVFVSMACQLLVDFAGWFTGPSAAPSTDGLFVPITPARVLDTRSRGVPIYPNGTIEVAPPAAAAAVVESFTLTQARGPGYVTGYAAGTPRPSVSSANADGAGDIVTNLAVVRLSNRGIALYSSMGTHALADLAGWFLGTTATATLPVPPNLPPPPPAAWCPSALRAAVVDRAAERAWLCRSAVASAKFPITTARSQPRPATYHVYAKDKLATSTFGGHFSYLENFVAFAHGIYTGARIAFHAVPRDAAGHPFQPYATVGTAAWYGATSGCIRVLPAQSQVIWDFLQVGDPVVVVS